MRYLNRFFCWMLMGLFAVASNSSFSQVVAAQSPAPNSFDVLCYHNVLEVPLQDPEALTTSTAELVQHFSWLKQQGYNIVSIDDLIDAKAGKKALPPKAILLTFDDGFRGFYTTVFPLLKAFNYPAVLAIVGSWLELKPGDKSPYPGHNYTRESYVTPEQVAEMAASGLVEIASHSFNLHRGILSNPQQNVTPAAVTRTYDQNNNTYETSEQYQARVRADLEQNSEFIRNITGNRPRVMVWPYGAYNLSTVNIAQALGMPVTLTLDEGLNQMEEPLGQIRRILIAYHMTIEDLSVKLHAIPVKPEPERVMYVDLDQVYDPDQSKQEKKLGDLLERVKAMMVNTVYVKAFSDPEGRGAANSVYFPNRYLPMRANLFNRVSWQLQSRTEVKVFAWMPLMAFELPPDNLLANHRVEMDLPSWDPRVAYADINHSRLSLFDENVRNLISGLYEDLAKNALFDGILFHDDGTLSDHEDSSIWALEYYASQWGLPKSLDEIRQHSDSYNKWVELKSEFLTRFSLDLVHIVHQYQPRAKTARTIFAEAILNPEATAWLGQSYSASLRNYDYTVIETIPFLDNSSRSASWLRNLLQKIAAEPHGLEKTVFELPSIDKKLAKHIDSNILVEHMKLLQQQGALSFGYEPDDFLNNQPEMEIIKPAISMQKFPFSGKTE